MAEQRMRCRCAALGSAQVQRAGLKLDVGPLQAAQFRCSQAMPEGNQDHGRVTLAPAIAPCGLDELLDFTLCGRSSAFGFRNGVTVRFACAGETILRCDLAMKLAP
jgi:hypothetical protein